MAIKQVVKCPECSRFFSLNGLSGHLRFSHGMSKEKAAKVMVGLSRKKTPKRYRGKGKMNEYEEVLSCIDKLVDINERIISAKDMHHSFWTGITKAGQVTIDALKKAESNVREELQRFLQKEGVRG